MYNFTLVFEYIYVLQTRICSSDTKRFVKKKKKKKTSFKMRWRTQTCTVRSAHTRMSFLTVENFSFYNIVRPSLLFSPLLPCFYPYYRKETFGRVVKLMIVYVERPRGRLTTSYRIYKTKNKLRLILLGSFSDVLLTCDVLRIILQCDDERSAIIWIRKG